MSAERETSEVSEARLTPLQRSSNDLAGLTLMGIRQYNTTTGRFLTTDPIFGGNANPYMYPTDPINDYDVTGRMHFSCGWVTYTLYFNKTETRVIAAIGFLMALQGIALSATGILGWAATRYAIAITSVAVAARAQNQCERLR